MNVNIACHYTPLAYREQGLPTSSKWPHPLAPLHSDRPGGADIHQPGVSTPGGGGLVGPRPGSARISSQPGLPATTPPGVETPGWWISAPPGRVPPAPSGLPHKKRSRASEARGIRDQRRMEAPLLEIRSRRGGPAARACGGTHNGRASPTPLPLL